MSRHTPIPLMKRDMLREASLEEERQQRNEMRNYLKADCDGVNEPMEYDEHALREQLKQTRELVINFDILSGRQAPRSNNGD